MPAQQAEKRWRVLPDGSKVRDPYAGRASSRKTPRTHAEANALAAELGVSFPSGVKTLAQKVDLLSGR